MSGDLDTQVRTFVEQVLGAMGLSLAIDLEETPDNIRMNLTGDGAGQRRKEIESRATDVIQCRRALERRVFALIVEDDARI